MADVFISYKRERRPAAHHLQKVLQAHGYSAWYDYGLVPGEDFEERLMGELRKSRAVVVLWCGLSVRSPWVLKEANEARALGTLTPAWIEKAVLPGDFGKLDVIDISGWDGDPSSSVLFRLLRAIGDRIGRGPAPNFNEVAALHDTWVAYGRPSLSRFRTEAAPSFDPAIGLFADVAKQASGVGAMIGSAVQSAAKFMPPASARALDQTASVRETAVPARPVLETSEPEIGQIYDGKVVKVFEFGVLVNFFGAKDGLVHVSQMKSGRVVKPGDVVKEGDIVKVKLLGLDDRGKVRLSMRAVDQITGEDLEKAGKA